MNTRRSDANADMAKYWGEEAGPTWVRDEVVFDLMLTPFNHALVEALDPQPGETILDVGCGFASTTLAIAGRGAHVHGVDISPPMIQRAIERTTEAGVNASFAVCDAQEDDLGGPYDAATSRFGVMFFADPVRAFHNFVTAVRPGGRLAFVCWQTLDRNPWMSAATEVLRGLLDDPPPAGAANVGPFAFGDVAFVESLLADAGWVDVKIAPFEASVRMGGNDGVPGAVNQVLGSSAAKALLALGDETMRDSAATMLTKQFEAVSVNGIVSFAAATWIVTATAPA